MNNIWFYIQISHMTPQHHLTLTKVKETCNNMIILIYVTIILFAVACGFLAQAACVRHACAMRAPCVRHA